MMERLALIGARIFDGERFHEHKALVLRGGKIEALVATADLDPTIPRRDLAGGVLAPGFIDAQVNGGGGIMLNDAPRPETMARIAAAHRIHGTTSLLPTLITDGRQAIESALEAAADSVRSDQGVAGLHLEGPHLAPARKGAHPAEFMRPVVADDIALYISFAERIGTLLLTLAVEQVTAKQVAELTEAGIIVSIGHSDAKASEAQALFDAGAHGVTHLFNAMSQLGNREPGLVGAAIDHPSVWCGIIADGHHVDPISHRLALRAKRAVTGPGRLFLVTDAMALVGSTSDHFLLHGRTVRRTPGDLCAKLTLDDGTIAGSDLDMASAIRFCVERLDLSLAEALAMATSYPARFLKITDRGMIKPGLRADLVHLDASLSVTDTWLSGRSASGA
ncbi:N-acetylglucosamine-6-phosphate deacetylase [Rhizobium alvei]|uniref:N-acetylglucosamine-6-phosphate deacetylase n=1 Tax=Rhizobium alvei TaxID=1132659 RepID=A0ABT8YI52_9HYPH|nr:N-acetylglucosamine-6-phosphate deacetylase [Rhizobium alvei]MDO6963373.1 N-acetylglucosamine-6-phosphate deacetylase [Rhizobium alvei]